MSSEKKWFVVHTYSGYEEKAKTALLQRAIDKGIQDKIGEVHIPHTQKETVTKTGKKKVVSRTSFPGYIMVEMVLDDDTKYLIKDTPKITGFVGNGRNPQPMPDREVMAMLSPETAPVEQVVPEAEVLYKKGDSVKVIDGPFSNFDGVIDEVRPEKAKVRVLVSIFGRETPVELSFGQIESV